MGGHTHHGRSDIGQRERARLAAVEVCEPWPSSIAHATHNSAWGIMVGFTATSSPLLVNGYLLGDFGIVITVAAAIGAALVGRLVPPGGDQARQGKDTPVLDPTAQGTTTSTQAP